MGVHWLWFAVVVAAARALELTDEEYYQMPRLFELDDFEECLSSRRGAYCVGTFDLLPYGNDQLLTIIKHFSTDKYHFNHTHIHRGYCITSRCAHIQQSTLKGRFETCVDNITKSQYGLETNLTRLEYCRTASQGSRPVDNLDTAFAYIVGLIVLFNVVGTAYDVLRSADGKPNKLLMTWSLKVNWGRLTANYADGDPRLAALKPIQGMKAMTLILIMLAHSVLAYHMTYVYNPLFFEKSSHHPMSVYFQNGTSIVQTFIMVSNFLLAYNLLLHADGSPTRQLSLKMLPKCLLHRMTRILPLYMFILGMAMTWWSLASDGPLWAPLVGGECSRCRDKWWTQLLFINNLVRPDVKCLIHTWFLAVDMQLYVVSAILTLTLGRNPRLGLKILVGLFSVSVISNFLIAYFFDLRPMVTLMFPEYMHTQFEGENSFKWLYQAPWDSLPAALVGIFVAFLHYHLQKEGVEPKESLVFRMVYRLTVPSMFLWVFLGYFMKGVTSPVAVALYAAADRAAFMGLTATAMYGFFNQVDSVWWRFLSWHGWEVLGRMSLPIYLVHWLYALTPLAARPYASPAALHEVGGQFLWTVFVSYWTALPLHLGVELPAQRFLQALLS